MLRCVFLPVCIISAEALTNVASSIAASIGLESQGGQGGTDYVGGENDNDAVYIMDPNQAAIEVDMSSVGVTMNQDGQMILAGDDESEEGQLIVQDIHGNQFRRVTGVDETGKPVIFFQLSEQSNHEELETTSSMDGTATTT